MNARSPDDRARSDFLARNTAHTLYRAGRERGQLRGPRACKATCSTETTGGER